MVPTATATCIIPPDAASPAASRIVFLRIGKLAAGGLTAVIQSARHGTPARRRERGDGNARGPPSTACATRPTATALPAVRQLVEERQRRRRLSVRVGRRFVDAVPGCVGTRRSTAGRCRRARARRARGGRWSPWPRQGRVPVSCRSDVKGIPETRAPAVAGRLSDEHERRVAPSPPRYAPQPLLEQPRSAVLVRTSLPCGSRQREARRRVPTLPVDDVLERLPAALRRALRRLPCGLADRDDRDRLHVGRDPEQPARPSQPSPGMPNTPQANPSSIAASMISIKAAPASTHQ